MGKRRLDRGESAEQRRQAKSRWTARTVVARVVVVIGVLIALLAIQSGGKLAAGTSGSARVGSPAPDFTLRLMNGQTVTLSSLKGKPILVNFWHSG
jgi:cytochrome oxidase Cu insertion factor (SCO1/SenC/PrrC family)